MTLAGLTQPAARTVRQSVFGGIATGERLGSASLLHSVRLAFVDGMDVSLAVSAGVAVAGMLLALTFLPRTSSSGELEEALDGDGAGQTPSTKEVLVATTK